MICGLWIALFLATVLTHTPSKSTLTLSPTPMHRSIARILTLPRLRISTHNPAR